MFSLFLSFILYELIIIIILHALVALVLNYTNGHGETERAND